MSPTPTESLSRRERVRQRTLAEIREIALAQVDAEGAEKLSLNAIAKSMGMSGPALYRYFASREDLLSALVTDSYGQLAAAVREAADRAASRSPLERLDAIADGYRRWACAHPRRYAMLFGPRPDGPADTDETIAVINEGMVPILAALGALSRPDGADPAVDERLAGQLRAWAHDRGLQEESPFVLRLGVLTWARIHAIVSLELAGAFTAMGLDAGLLLESELADIATARG